MIFNFRQGCRFRYSLDKFRHCWAVIFQASSDGLQVKRDSPDVGRLQLSIRSGHSNSLIGAKPFSIIFESNNKQFPMHVPLRINIVAWKQTFSSPLQMDPLSKFPMLFMQIGRKIKCLCEGLDDWAKGINQRYFFEVFTISHCALFSLHHLAIRYLTLHCTINSQQYGWPNQSF